MDGGKRAKGRAYVITARLLPSAVSPISSYEDYVGVHLNIEYVRVANIVDMADAMEIGLGKATIPTEWINLLTTDPEERAKWIMRELRKELG